VQLYFEVFYSTLLHLNTQQNEIKFAGN